MYTRKIFFDGFGIFLDFLKIYFLKVGLLKKDSSKKQHYPSNFLKRYYNLLHICTNE